MDYVSIPFPSDLYKLIVLRSGGKLDPARLAIDQVEGFINANHKNSRFWTDEGLVAFAQEQTTKMPDVGDLDRGFQWGPLSLPNGTELRMRYRNEAHYARVEHEQIAADGKKRPSVSQWVRGVAGNTSRNAWHDVWIRFPGEKEFRYSDNVRHDRTKKLVV